MPAPTEEMALRSYVADWFVASKADQRALSAVAEMDYANLWATARAIDENAVVLAQLQHDHRIHHVLAAAAWLFWVAILLLLVLAAFMSLAPESFGPPLVAVAAHLLMVWWLVCSLRARRRAGAHR
jgi:hypothetical protein